VLKKKKLPETYERMGPPTEMKTQVKAFKKKHKKTIVKKGRVVAVLKYAKRTPEAVLKEALKDKYLKGKVKTCKLTS
jgi:tRNA nucleotidyltransferase (CCA-adding enzyme)